MDRLQEKTTAPYPPVGADGGQSLSQKPNQSIAEGVTEHKPPERDLEEILRQISRVNDPAYLPTVSMNDLYEQVYPGRPPVVDGLLYAGTYLFVGAPKVGKSFLMAQLAYHVSMGLSLWGYEVRQGTVLYLALEEQLKGFVREHTDTRLIIIDTLQKIREAGAEKYSYANDYEVITKLKRFADISGVCLLVVHHTRKQQADDKFDMISGTNGLLGAAKPRPQTEAPGRAQRHLLMDGTSVKSAFALLLARVTEPLTEKKGRDKMQRTISAMVGKGSINHNSRKFTAENVAPERTHLNIDYCNENIEKVYHKLFDEALKRYNDKQTRADRKIENYYDKIRTGKQEKPFHELILQIGDKDNMSAESENGQLAKQILDEYYKGFRERNPNLYVFSVHLHMDEATPHIHIDFVPFTTGSKRGLDTRVSLKQALVAQGFKGGTRGDTEWSQWVLSEKEQLAAVMERYGIEWEQKGTHDKHLSVLDYKKQEREKEISALDSQIAEKTDVVKSLSDRVQNFDDGIERLQAISDSLDTAPEYNLPESSGLMTAKTYKTKFAEPLIKRLKSLIKTVFARCFEAWDSYHRLNATNASLYRENQVLSRKNSSLNAENAELKEQNRDYKLLRKVFGSKQIDGLLEQAKQSKQRDKRFRDNQNER